MKYTTLPTKPGRYIDRTGDELGLTEDLKWYHCRSMTPAPRLAVADWLPFTDAPDEGKPKDVDDKTQRIDSVDDLKNGDIVYFHDDPTGYPFMTYRHCYIRVNLQRSSAPLWLCNALSGDVKVDKSFFDHAERPKPSWPEPEGTKMRMYLGADGELYIYAPLVLSHQAPWLYADDGHYVWGRSTTLAMKRPEALPLREFTTPEEQA